MAARNKQNQDNRSDPDPGANNRLLKVGEAAEMLGVCRQSVYNMIQKESLPHIRVLRRQVIRIPEKQLKRWIDEQTKQQAESR